MKIESVLQTKGRDVITISPSATVADAVDTIHKRRIGALVVTGGDGGVLGIFSERDVMDGLAKHGARTLDSEVRENMTELVHSCTRANTVVEVMSMMTRRRIRHIPVVERSELLGIVSIGDLVKARIAETESEANALKEYIATG